MFLCPLDGNSLIAHGFFHPGPFEVLCLGWFFPIGFVGRPFAIRLVLWVCPRSRRERLAVLRLKKKRVDFAGVKTPQVGSMFAAVLDGSREIFVLGEFSLLSPII